MQRFGYRPQGDIVLLVRPIVLVVSANWPSPHEVGSVVAEQSFLSPRMQSLNRSDWSPTVPVPMVLAAAAAWSGEWTVAD